jgi:hypothetical protein
MTKIICPLWTGTESKLYCKWENFLFIARKDI